MYIKMNSPKQPSEIKSNGIETHRINSNGIKSNGIKNGIGTDGIKSNGFENDAVKVQNIIEKLKSDIESWEAGKWLTAC